MNINLMAQFENIKVIIFDADDTLWDCQSYFRDVEHRYCRLLSQYGDEAEVSRRLFATETANMPLTGFGAKAFTISLVENAVRMSGGLIGAEVIGEIVELGKSLLRLPSTPLPGVCDALAMLRDYRLVLFTKGELLDQQGKLQRSGLAHCFEHVEIVTDKTREAYLSLLSRLGVRPEDCLMVGNSFKSDIAPALSIGASAAYIPFHVTWKLEQMAEYDHEHLACLSSMSELPALLGI